MRSLTSRLFLVALPLLAVPRDSAVAQPATVILVRHAERAAAPAGDPALTEAGIKRALDLAAALATARVSSIVTTQFQRTQLTAKPLADSLHLTPTVVRAGGPTLAHVDSVAAAVRRHSPGDVVLVVGHSNTIPAIIRALGGPIMPDLCDSQYSMLFVLEFPAAGAPRLIRAKYGAPDPPDSDGCARMLRP
jgi:phosphohistidine phosphatase SixA